MLPTPSTSHVAFDRIYEPAEDSFLMLDTLSSEAEKAFLHDRFAPPHGQNSASKELKAPPPPIIAEIGTGSGVVLAFVNAHVEVIFGRSDILAIGVDVNWYASKATQETVRIAAQEQTGDLKPPGCYLGNVIGDLAAPLRGGVVDVLIFNPPYVPTAELPGLPSRQDAKITDRPSYEESSHLLSLSYAGGADGMEITNKLLLKLPDTLSSNGVAYILLCAQNKPEEVKKVIRAWGAHWFVETVGSSGKKGGWEKLQIIRIWRVKMEVE